MQQNKDANLLLLYIGKRHLLSIFLESFCKALSLLHFSKKIPYCMIRLVLLSTLFPIYWRKFPCKSFTKIKYLWSIQKQQQKCTTNAGKVKQRNSKIFRTWDISAWMPRCSRIVADNRSHPFQLSSLHTTIAIEWAIVHSIGHISNQNIESNQNLQFVGCPRSFKVRSRKQKRRNCIKYMKQQEIAKIVGFFCGSLFCRSFMHYIKGQMEKAKWGFKRWHHKLKRKKKVKVKDKSGSRCS